MKSETRKVLEEQLRLAKQRAAERSVQTEDREHTAEDDFSIPPKSLTKEFAAAFAELPELWRRYVVERERTVEKEREELGKALRQQQWLDELFEKNRLRLCRLGVCDRKRWLEHLAAVDAAMDENPAGVLRDVAGIYGVALSAAGGVPAEGHFSAIIGQKLDGLERGYRDMRDALRRQQAAYWRELRRSFAQAVVDGRPAHPFFSRVQPEMDLLLESGLAADLEEAYQQAVWMRPDLRKELIKAEAEKILAARADEAEKSKQAGFAVKGKPAAVPEENLTTREVLERFMYGK